MENKKNELVSDDTFPKYISDFLWLARPITSSDLSPADKEFLENLVITLKRKELKQSGDIFQLRNDFSDKEFQLQAEKEELLEMLQTVLNNEHSFSEIESLIQKHKK